MSYDIFISYRRVDGKGDSNVAAARTFKMAFENRGYVVFFDYSECTDGRFVDRILPAIRSCRFFVLVLTTDALDRCKNSGDWLRREIEEALRYNIKIVPITPSDKQFYGYPPDLPPSLKTLSEDGGYQVTTIHMDRMFDKCIDTFIEDRMAPPANKRKDFQVSLPILKVKTDADCLLFVDGEEKCPLRANTINKIPMAVGEYVLRFVSIDNPSYTIELVFDMPNRDKVQNISFCELRNKRKAAYMPDVGVWGMTKEEARHIAGEMFLEDERILVEEERRRRMEEEYRRESNKVFSVRGVDFTMVYVEGGTFSMGSTEGEGDEKPVHDVTLSGFYLGQTVVTQALWKAVFGDNPSYFVGDSLPVEKVSWNECQYFVKKLNEMLEGELSGMKFRLPTEAEWEYAARGGRHSSGFLFSGSSDIEEVAWYWKNSGDVYLPGVDEEWKWEAISKNNDRTHPVAKKKANELGLYDMTGNVWEWCEDWYGSYSEEGQINPHGPAKGTDHISRGGSWRSPAERCRVTFRGYDAPDEKRYRLGFRLAL